MQVVQVRIEPLRRLVDLWTHGTCQRATNHRVVDVVLVREVAWVEDFGLHHAERGLALDCVVACRALGVTVSLLVVGLAQGGGVGLLLEGVVSNFLWSSTKSRVKLHAWMCLLMWLLNILNPLSTKSFYSCIKYFPWSSLVLLLLLHVGLVD
jgi:hypothetical protein